MGNNSGQAADTSYRDNAPSTLPVMAYEGSSSRRANHVMSGDCCVSADNDKDADDDADDV